MPSKPATILLLLALSFLTVPARAWAPPASPPRPGSPPALPDAPQPQQDAAGSGRTQQQPNPQQQSPNPQNGASTQQGPDQGQQQGQEQGQQQGQEHGNQNPEAPAPNLHEQAERDLKAEEKQRVMGIMSAFNTTANQHAVPLSRTQKMRLAFRSAIDPWQFGLALVDAGIGQAQDSYAGYGQGMAGYAKRFGAAYVDAFDGGMIGNGLLPALLHQDPRYFQMGPGTPEAPNRASKRFGHAALSTVICRGDNGRRQFNLSNVLGNFIAGGISNAYYPDSDRGAGLTVTRALTVTAEGIVGAELLEFWPDIQKKFFRKRDPAGTAGSPSP